MLGTDFEGDSAPDSLVSMIQTEGIPFPECLKPHYMADPAFARILEQPKAFRNFILNDDLIYMVEEGGKRRLCIPKCLINN
jgi:hypothetical protein